MFTLTRWVRVLGIACAGSCLLVAGVSAEVVFTVDSTLDQVDDDLTDGVCHTAAGTCTLRAAVMQANVATGAGATIQLAASTYTLTRPRTAEGEPRDGDLNILSPATGQPVISLIGVNQASTIIDANQIDRVLDIGPGRTVHLSHLTLRNGYESAGAGSGAGIFNHGTLTVSFCTISDNNLALNAYSGGGIANSYELFLVDSTVTRNVAQRSGGGIGNGGYLEVTRSTISQNASRADGGGISSTGASTTLIVTDSTIALNSADRDGGGILASDANIYNSTIAFNGADADHDVDGGIGGGIYADGIGPFNLANTLVVGNNLADSPIYDDCYGPVTSYYSNLLWEVGPLCSITTASGDGWAFLDSLDNLGPLQRNGGLTETFALLPGSNAIDAGDSTLGCPGPDGQWLVTDQRGVARVHGLRCDVGAFEEGAIFFDDFESGDLSAW